MDAERVVDDGGRDALRAQVVEVMARLVDGDRDAVWDLHVLAEVPVRHILRAEARRIDVRIGDEDVFDLTIDAAIDLAKLARSWDPDGALPWVWARKRITHLVHDHIGQHTRELDDEHLEIEAPPVLASVPEPREVLRSVAEGHPAARQLELQLSESVSERDATIWLGVQLEKGAGNRSPAVTIAAECGLRPDAVRKVCQRVTERLSAVA
ncbi:MAG: hypothetical protein ABL966_05790 [Acidimicrobiales bacterium]